MTQAFVYHWQELSTNKWYIGSRTGKGCHPNDGYITSSKVVLPLIETTPTDWKRTIIATGDPKDILNFEIKLLKALDAKNDPMSYNRHNGDGKFTTLGMPGWNRGKPHPIETRRKISKVKKGKKNPCSEETRRKIIEGNKGKLRSEETCRNISEAKKGKKNPMFGKTHSEETKQKMRETRKKT